MGRDSLYQRDLAYVHHVGFSGFSRDASAGLLGLLHRAGIRGGTLVDLGCGSGAWAQAAGRAGFKVIGVDSSPAMIHLAKRVAPDAKLFCASLHDFPLPPCDAVTAIGEGLNYVPPVGVRAPELARLFARVARALRPGGLFVFDVVVAEGAVMNYRAWRSGEDWAVLVEVSEEASKRLLTRRITTFRRIRCGWRRTEETHRIRLFSGAEIQRSLRRLGFSVRTARCYGAMALGPRRLALIARKPG